MTAADMGCFYYYYYYYYYNDWASEAPLRWVWWSAPLVQWRATSECKRRRNGTKGARNADFLLTQIAGCTQNSCAVYASESEDFAQMCVKSWLINILVVINSDHVGITWYTNNKPSLIDSWYMLVYTIPSHGWFMIPIPTWNYDFNRRMLSAGVSPDEAMAAKLSKALVDDSGGL